MATVNINTVNPAYIALKNDATALRAALKPHLKRYFLMAEADQAAWRDADPLLRGVLDWAEKIVDLSEGD